MSTKIRHIAYDHPMISLHLHCKVLTALAATSMVIVQFMSADLFFFMINISSTFPFIFAELESVRVPALSSLPSSAAFGNWPDFNVTTAFTFLVDFIPALPLAMNNSPTAAPLYVNVAVVFSNL